jgi:protein-tyrosine phosphatase
MNIVRLERKSSTPRTKTTRRRQDSAMIDLHSHVLPGIDDGAANVAEALELAEAAAAGGTRVLAATPHVRADHPGVRPEELLGRCEEINARLRQAGVRLEVIQGGEVDLEWATAASDEELRLVSYCGRGTDLLVETPYGSLPPDFEDRVQALSARGFRALLAHPERSPTLQRDPERIAGLIAHGVLVQLTARSLVPSTPQSAAHVLSAALVAQGLAHVLASDAHAASGPAPPDLARGVAAASAIVGPRAHWMASDAPAAIVAGEPLPRAPRLAPSA